MVPKNFYFAIFLFALPSKESYFQTIFSENGAKMWM